MTKRKIRMVGTNFEQLHLWVKGESVHARTGSPPPNDWECCPDFSCCKPELQAPEAERRAFSKATEYERARYLSKYLAAFVATVDPRARVIGG